jgi:hypothetical protein
MLVSVSIDWAMPMMVPLKHLAMPLYSSVWQCQLVGDAGLLKVGLKLATHGLTTIV